jgi:predicted nucleotidyltransferase
MMLSVRVDRPVDAITVAVSREIARVTHALGLSYFLVGAMARDIVLTHVFDLSTGLATRDVDFGVAVKDWAEFNAIKALLIDMRRFRSAANIQQRVYFQADSGSTGYPVDIIPFGGVEAPPLSIAWPPEQSEIMSVAGYDDALATALPVQIDVGEQAFTVPVVSLPGLALLKLFAWRDRHAETRKDAQDIAILFRNYIAAGNRDRLYDAEMSLLQAVDYDVDLAGARLLGKDVRRIAAPATSAQASALLNNEPLVERLATHMSAAFQSADDAIDAARRLLDQFKAGFLQA